MKKLSLIILICAAVILGSWFFSNKAIGSVSFEVPTQKGETYRNYSFFSATTTTATSTNTTDGVGGYFPIAGAERVTLYFSRAWNGGNAGTSTFSIEVSPDGTNWYDYNKLISNSTNTNAQTLTRVGSVAIVAATSTTVASLDLENDTFFAIRCIVIEETDGAHTCSASAEF